MKFPKLDDYIIRYKLDSYFITVGKVRLIKDEYIDGEGMHFPAGFNYDVIFSNNPKEISIGALSTRNIWKNTTKENWKSDTIKLIFEDIK